MTVIVLGMFVGAILGLTGAGGGIFAVPALVYGLGWSVQQATPVALLAVAGAASVGAIEAWRKGLVRYRAALLMAVTGISATSVGVETAYVLPEHVLMLLFALAMLIVASRMHLASRHLQAAGSSPPRDALCRLNPAIGKIRWTPYAVIAISIIGLLSGFLTGLLGVGGGFVIVPALRRVSDISLHGIIATSLAVIAIVAGSAVIMVWLHGASLPANVAIPFVAATAAGMLAGRIVVHRVPAGRLQRLFALMMAGVALSFAVKAISADRLLEEHGLCGHSLSAALVKFC